MFRYSHLHSTMFLLIHQQQWTSITMCPHLHSTMFLLILNVSVLQTDVPNLHSTMFLLIPNKIWENDILMCQFTFHNVSINTSYNAGFEQGFTEFTFHNVSINTRNRKDIK